MSNLIQIKRSATAAAPGSLANGELAFTSNGDILYIGSPNGSVISIGGLRTPGTLTANQALVANSTGGINEVRAGTANVGAIFANGSLGTSGQALFSNSTGVYWGNVAASVSGSNTQIQFNDSGTLAGDSGFTFNKDTDTLTVGTATVNSTNFSGTANNATNLGGVAAAGYQTTAGLSANVATLTANNSTNLNGQPASFYTNATNISAGTLNNARLPSAINVTTVNAATLSVGTTAVVNSTGFTTGANVTIESTGELVINPGAGIFANGSLGTAGQVLHSNGTSVYWSTDDEGVTSVATGVGLSGGPITTTGTVSVLANNGITANTTGLFVAQGTGTVVNSTGVHVNSAYIGTLTANNADNLNGQPASFYTNATNLATGTVPTARLGTGTANSTTFLAGDQSYKTAVTSIASGNGLSGGPISSTGTLSVQAGEGIISNATGVFVRPGTGVTVNATGVHIGQSVGTTDTVTFGRLTVTGNTALGDAITDIVSINGSVNTNFMPSANVTYGLGNNTVRWAQVFVANVHSNTGYFEGDVQIAGNLSVLGTTFTVSANNLIINDSLLQLAANNISSDLLDIGFFGSYNPDGGAHEHAGLFRDASDDTFKLFKGLVDSPNNVVNTSGVGYTIATLQSYLNSGGITTNATSVTITANASVNIAITANTLSLSTALSGTSGGTGRATIANNAILVGNTTNGYNALALGTDGQVLQSNGTALIYDSLDGGSF